MMESTACRGAPAVPYLLASAPERVTVAAREGRGLMTFRSLRGAALAGAMAFSAMAAPAEAGSLMREGFAFPADGEIKVVVFRPDVQVGSLGVGGLDAPNADWTNAARANIQQALENAANARQANLRFLGEYDGDQGKVVDTYRGLFEAVAGSVFLHAAVPGNRLPTKLIPDPDPKAPKRYRMDWTLGDGAARLRELTGGDYAMFVYTKDSYGDAGRKVAQALMAGLLGAYMPAGVHVGYAGLVDLRTGDVVWFNTDLAMGGDPREPDGAAKRVDQLLRGLPVRGSAPAAP